ncbi:pentatricopeptide repeat-containing protein At1g71460, chloroplastic [Andrographis paniculata]|uniref:pentatricopeptide repeat-containing protein At1g71460, chloroplastic n=1 Tax=Andrographis paniculata TaxID=175694 RepID=UPI0021E8C5B8|nr:pentatricopeptide repeat-containing protein At1g71460, chloroplastic [Andrographis paniculata]XP_051137231.1 pentatricopeptide repeat-containing protein At1g71460, chloroplastic [Andrographis paniculata]XP_051137237.1 pentatricopeptide repeat-containing protein At1g71460, chloroplastic [Andrographis paniculata]
MEALSSSYFTIKPQPNLPHSFHQRLVKSPYKISFNGSGNLIVKALAAPLPPFEPQSRKPKKFHENDAFPNSIPIHRKNPHAIYKDIRKFARENKLKEALAILDYMDRFGIPTNVTTFSSLIAACVRAKSIDAAKQVHVHIRINGLEKNVFLQTKLVNMYASCGSIEDAKRLFESMSVTSIYPWNALLRGNVVLGHRNYREVLSSFLEMRYAGVELNVYTFSCLIKSLAGARALNQGLKTHGILVKNGLLGSCITRTSLVDMYFKCGKINLACRVFEEVEERDVVVWGAMIAGFAHNRLQWEALAYTRRMVNEGIEVNSVVLTSILPVIGEILAPKIGKEVHAYVIKTKGYSKQLFIQSGLIDMYCKCGDLASGRKVFYGSMERNTISWTTLLSGYVANGRLDQALRSIIWMQQEGFKPDAVTVTTVLPVCGKLRALKQGKEIHSFAVKNGFLPAVSIATALMMMYTKCGRFDYCLKVFDSMERRNVISWTAMIECYIECKLFHEALSVFRLMQLSKHRPDSVTMARILSVCGELKVEKFGKEIHGQVLKKNLQSVPSVSSEIVRMYGSWGKLDTAKSAFEAIPVKGSMTWTAIIEAYGCNGQYQEAIHVFEQMMSGGFSPNQFTFKVLLSICEKGSFVDDAQRFFSLMTRKYKIKASEEHYSSIINLLIHSGRIEEAGKFMELRSSSVRP